MRAQILHVPSDCELPPTIPARTIHDSAEPPVNLEHEKVDDAHEIVET